MEFHNVWIDQCQCAWDLEAGNNELAISGADLMFPENLVLERVEPRRIVIRVAITAALDSGVPK